MKMAAVLLAVWCLVASAAEEPAGQSAQKPKEKPVLTATVVNRDGTTVELRSLALVSESTGLFGSSPTQLGTLPVTAGNLHLEVPMDKLTKIEIIPADKTSKEVKLKLTSTDGKTLAATLDNGQKIKWKGTHSFADSEATLDLSAVKEIVLGQEKK